MGSVIRVASRMRKGRCVRFGGLVEVQAKGLGHPQWFHCKLTLLKSH